MSSSSLLHSLPLPRPSTTSLRRSTPTLRRRSLLLLSPAIPTLSLFTPPSRAEDIPLFGLRKKLKKVEEEAEEILREREKAVEGEILAAEQGIQAVEGEILATEQGIQAAEKDIAGGIALGLGSADLVQAAAVAGAEAIGVLVGVSVVNGILGTEGKS